MQVNYRLHCLKYYSISAYEKLWLLTDYCLGVAHECDGQTDGQNCFYSNSTLQRRILKSNGRGATWICRYQLSYLVHRCTNRLLGFIIAAHAYVWQAFLFCTCPILLCYHTSNLRDGSAAPHQTYISHQWLVHRPRTKNSLRHFAHTSPNFFMERSKMRNLPSIFDPSRR